MMTGYTLGLDLLVNTELKVLAIQKGLKMRVLLMTILTDYITTKSKEKRDQEM